MRAGSAKTVRGLACLGALACGVVCAAAAGAAERPNIVLLYTDDQARWGVGAYGNPDIHTPNMDRLARQGARFANAFVVTPVCSPSRVSLIASRYGTEVGITDWINPRSEATLGLDPAIVTWPEVLAEAGYTNAIIGKWHLGTQPEFHPRHVGFSHFFGFLSGGNRPVDPRLEVEGTVKQLSGPLPDLLVDDAIGFLNRHRDRPFMLSVQFRAPHAPYAPVPEEDSAHYKGIKIRIPDYPGIKRARVEQLLREYYGSISSVDRNVGRLLRRLDELSLTAKTVVIFTSDHGYNIGHHGIRHKGNGTWILEERSGRRPNMFDTSLATPLIIRWPGVVEPGRVITETVSHLDFYPSILAMAGVEQPAGVTVRGRDFTPLLRGESVAWDNTLFGQYDMHHGKVARMRMIRTPEWKLIRHYEADGQDEFYHLAEDPDERVNRIADPGRKSRIAALSQRLRAWQVSIDDPLLREVR